MRKIISCAVFKPYIESIEERMNINFDITYLDVKQHNYPSILAENLQKEIDQSAGVDEILLLYGLCGNATLSLQARDIKITILRVHDCLSVLLGSRERFVRLFSHRLSQGWSCLAYDQKDNTMFNTTSEQYREYVEEYGEENAMYIMEQMYPVSKNPLVYIDCGLAEDIERVSQYEQPLEVIEGNLSYLSKVLLEPYDDDVVVLHKGEHIKVTYDLMNVFHAEKVK